MTNLSDFLKVKKVRCVNGHGRHLTVGETYYVLGLSVPNNLVQVENDNGFITEYDSEKFEPVLDSAENALQGVELTPEFEAVEPKFKVGDKVYKYGETDVKTVLEVFEDGYMRISNYPHRVNHEVICHATPENHALLSKPFPDIEFEQPPKPLTGNDLCIAMLKGKHINIMCQVDGNETNIRIITLYTGDFFYDRSGNRYSQVIPVDTTGEPLTESILND